MIDLSGEFIEEGVIAEDDTRAAFIEAYAKWHGLVDNGRVVSREREEAWRLYLLARNAYLRLGPLYAN